MTNVPEISIWNSLTASELCKSVKELAANTMRKWPLRIENLINFLRVLDFVDFTTTHLQLQQQQQQRATQKQPNMEKLFKLSILRNIVTLCETEQITGSSLTM